MNYKQAIAAMKKLWGAKAAWRVNDHAPTNEQRAAIAATLPALTAKYDAAKSARDARRAELLKDPEYVRLVAEARAAGDARDTARSTVNSYRITIGTADGMFFHVKAQGDSWQEAMDKARATASGSLKL